MSGENWESLITEKGFMRVPRALRLKRAELGITNNEYTILLDYVDYYSFSGTMNPYRHLTEVSGMSERGIKKVLASLEKKGFLKRRVSRHGNGRTNGVVFSIDPLVRKLRSIMKKSSPTVGEEMDTHVYEESFTPNTGEEFKKREEDKNTSAKNADVRARACGDACVSDDGEEGIVAVVTDYGFIRGTGGPDQEAPRNDRPGGKAGQIHLARAGEGPRGLAAGEEGEIIESGEVTGRSSPVSATSWKLIQRQIHPNPPLQKEGKKDRKWIGGDQYSSSRWYNEVWRGLYEEAAGQPALKGVREYRAAEAYFGRLRELNPEMDPGDVYGLAGDCAAFMIASQLEGGVFGWMHKPPDICLLASQAQSVEWHLRKMRRVISQSGPSTGSGRTDCDSLTSVSGGDGEGMTDVRISFREKLREGRDANEQIERVYGELRGIESRRQCGSFENDAGRGSGQALRQFDPSTLRQSSGRASSGRTVERRALRRKRG